MGGMWCDNEDEATNIPGLYASGECNYQYHGANRLGANSLLSCIFGGMVCGPAAVKYSANLENGSDSVDASVFDAARKREEDANKEAASRDGDENPYRIHEELGKMMTKEATVIRTNSGLDEAMNVVVDMQGRLAKAPVPDRTEFGNQALVFTRQLENMLILARAILKGARLRDETRGAHYKPDFPKRNDAEFLKTTMATWTEDGPEIEYVPVECKHIPPRERSYS
jgi:succinate dehydrogenase / fumarate reductase flavoprotein subunit